MPRLPNASQYLRNVITNKGKVDTEYANKTCKSTRIYYVV